MTDSDQVILESLLESGDVHLSGNVLAERLGISRVAIWSRLERLREAGFQFEAVRHKGYRLTAEPEELNGDLIRAYLARAGVDTPLLYFPEIDSTNSEAERQLAAGRPTPFVILASRQTSGRGRLGRAWHSPEEGNSYMSFVFRPNLAPARMQTFTLWMGVNLCQAINRRCGLPAKLKWPNDLILNGKKLGGMLTEARVDADSTRDLVFGFGLNVNASCEAWPDEVSSMATSLADAAGQPVPIHSVVASTIEAGLEAYDRFIREDYQSDLHALWKEYDSLHGKTVTASPDNGAIRGLAEGIDDDGALKVRVEGGQLVHLRAGEVSLGTAAAFSSDPS